ARRWDGTRAAALGGLGALLLHALVDWDLSYALFAFPLWFGFGLAREARRRAGGEETRGGAGAVWPRALTAALAGAALAGAALLGAGDALTELSARSLRAGAPEAALQHSGA